MANDYNKEPEGWKEISEDDFKRLFFHYIYKKPEFRQIFYNQEKSSMGGVYDAKLFEVEYDGWENMGVAIIDDFKAKKMKFYKFGTEERWKKNEGRFSSQFAGDNS
jgi:hypothetical protein